MKANKDLNDLFNKDVDDVYSKMFCCGHSIYDKPISDNCSNVDDSLDQEFDESIPINRQLFSDQAEKNVHKLFE